jgi:L-ascorbate metabolism protein UlaG (beta-lactamase superfamily)
VDSKTPVYLRANVQIEPLFNQWYAWSHLIAPATAALNVMNHHIKLMRSFVNAPQIHVASVRNPAMRGGPFVDLDPARVGDVERLLSKTEQQARILELARALQALNDLVVNEAAGSSLEPLYPRVPDALRGYVELTYDLSGRASFRLIEALIYKGPLYERALQSLLLTRVTPGDKRPFVFSTPRVALPAQVQISLPFADPRVDQLAALRREPQPLSHVREWLELDPAQFEAFDALITTEVPRRPPAAPEGLRVRYLGHASLLIETPEVTIMTDPLVGCVEGEGIGSLDLPERIDYVLLTHAHSDHVVLETLLELRARIGTVIVPRSSGSLEDPSLRLILENVGFPDVRELDELEVMPIPGGDIVGIPFMGEHGDLNVRSKTGHLIRCGGRKLLCLADSTNLDPTMYRHLRAWTGEVDALFIGMECDGAPVSWMYGPLLMRRLERKMDHSRRLCASDATQAWEIVRCFRPKHVYVYAMGQEEWLGFITSIRYDETSKPIVESGKLIALCAGEGIPARRLYGTQEIETA